MENRKTILVVDDELGPRESLRMILKPFCDIHTAEDGMTALRVLEQIPVDLMTLDLKMPGLSGIDVLEKVRRSNQDVMVVIVTGYGTLKSAIEAINLDAFDYVSKPFNVHEITSVVKRCLEVRDAKHTIRKIFSEVASLSEKGSAEFEWSGLMERIRGLLSTSGGLDVVEADPGFSDPIKLVARWVENSNSRAGHAERVCYYTGLLAREVGLSCSVQKELEIASYLHDIGMACISNRFVDGEGNLSSTDWAILKKHPLKSVELIEPLKLPSHVISSVRHHHERFDGTGYPDGLAGRDIPLGARILSLGSVYDSLTSKRPYSEAMDAIEAESEIRKCVGSLFDPELALTFLEVLKKQRAESRHRAFQQESEEERL